MHGDLCGPVTPASPGGRHYFLLLVDDVYRYMWVVLLGTKGATTDAIKHVQAAAENEWARASGAAHGQQQRVHVD
jgi:hypothetical protein